MSGLLDLFERWKMGEFNTGETVGSSVNMNNRTVNKRGSFDTDPKYIRQNKEVRDRLGRIIEPGSPVQNAQFNTRFSKPKQETTSKAELAQNLARKNPNVLNVDKSGNVTYKQDAGKTPNLAKDNMPSDPIVMGGSGTQQGDISFMQKLANMANVDFDKAMASWKDKGGFEGLMANPAFTMGLAFMQAGAEGKTLGQGALDNTLKAAGISQHYKSIIESRKQAPIQATATDIAEVKQLLSTMNVEDPSMIEKFIGKIKGKNVQQTFDIAAEDIAIALQQEMALLQKKNKSGKPLVFDTRRKLRIIKRLLESGKFKKKGGTFFTAATLESDEGGSFPEPKMDGGPIEQGKAYVVGEAGPEVIIPKSDGNVLTNDDSQIYAMLLAANPQLQKVSRQRAEKILRNRFPEYFEG